jgi:hypothetical protein
LRARRQLERRGRARESPRFTLYEQSE